MVLLPPGFAAFQNCFCAEYLFMGHSLNRQSEEKKLTRFKSQTSLFSVKLHHLLLKEMQFKMLSHTLSSQYTSFGPFSMEFGCSAHAYAGSLRVLWLPPPVQ